MLNKTTVNAAASGLLYIVLVSPVVTLKSATAAPDCVSVNELLLLLALTVPLRATTFGFLLRSYPGLCVIRDVLDVASHEFVFRMRSPHSTA